MSEWDDVMGTFLRLMDAEWEAVGGLGKQNLIDEIGLSYESMDILATMVDPSRSYVWSFTGTKVPAVKNTMAKSPLSARVIFNIDEGEVNVLDIAPRSTTLAMMRSQSM